MLILENTIWKSGQVITLTSPVEVEEGVTLTVEPGVTINGNGFSITAFGNIVMDGESSNKITLNNVSLLFSTNFQIEGYIKLDNVNFSNGAFLPATGYGSYGGFDVSNSVFNGVQGFYIWYPSDSSFIGNSFIQSSTLSIGVAASELLIKNNLFVGQWGSAAIEVWANYNDGINVVENSFLSTHLIALSIAENYTSASMNASRNYFGTSDSSIIPTMILDRTDTLKRFSVIDISDSSVAPSENTPKYFNSAPTGSVIIIGIPAKDQTLTVLNTLADQDGLGPKITYTWKADGVPIGVGLTYKLQSEDVGKQITVTASYIDRFGFGITESVTSAPTALIASVAPLQMVAPSYKGSDLDEWVFGTNSNNLILGGAGEDTLQGSGGNDVLEGGQDADVQDGGEGSDVYIIASAADYAADEHIEDSGTTGTDELRFASTTAATLTLANKLTGIESIVIGTGTKAVAVTTGKLAIDIDASQLSENLTIIGNAGANGLTGGAGNDTLRGNTGVDTFHISKGADTINDLGNGGADVIIISAGAVANATIVKAWSASDASLNNGIANISTNGLAVNLAAVTMPDSNGFNVANISKKGTTLTGSGRSDILSGNVGKDILIGNAGDDVIIGGRGADKTKGGEGRDLFVFAAGDSGQAKGYDVIADFQKGVAGIGDVIRYADDLHIGGSSAQATSNQASIEGGTGVAIFAVKSGASLSDALADIATSFTAAGDEAGDFALFQLNNTGSYYFVISDGVAGIGINDIVIQLTGVTSISGIDLSNGELTITT